MPNTGTVWIIDDDPIFQFYMKRLVDDHSLTTQICTFWNGEEASQALLSLDPSPCDHWPDVIFLDLNMPIMDGWHFLDELRNLPNTDDIPVYIMSSSIDPCDVEEAKRRKRVKDYLVKPIRSEDVQNLLSKHLQLREK